MISQLYPAFRQWSLFGSVYLISDTHFEDKDCNLMDPNWISPEEYVSQLKYINKNDTLIHLGDVGNPYWLDKIHAGYKVLIMGNHDTYSKLKSYFNEVCTGPLFISQKILLSHEPVPIDYALNIHGHLHRPPIEPDKNHLCISANLYDYKAANLKQIIHSGILKDIKDIHRLCIDNAIQMKEEYKNEL